MKPEGAIWPLAPSLLSHLVDGHPPVHVSLFALEGDTVTLYVETGPNARKDSRRLYQACLPYCQTRHVGGGCLGQRQRGGLGAQGSG